MTVVALAVIAGAPAQFEVILCVEGLGREKRPGYAHTSTAKGRNTRVAGRRRGHVRTATPPRAGGVAVTAVLRAGRLAGVGGLAHSC